MCTTDSGQVSSKTPPVARGPRPTDIKRTAKSFLAWRAAQAEGYRNVHSKTAMEQLTGLHIQEVDTVFRLRAQGGTRFPRRGGPGSFLTSFDADLRLEPADE